VPPCSEQPDVLLQPYDTKRKTVATTIKPWATPMTGGKSPSMFQQARFVGESLLVEVSYTPKSDAARLYNPRTGKLLASIGGDKQDIDSGAVVALAKKSTWAFGSFGGAKVFVYDVASGASHPTIAIANPKSTATRSHFAVFQKTDDGQVLVALRGDAMSGATLIDTTSRNGQRISFPLCAAR
jgi:hypothetical protein